MEINTHAVVGLLDALLRDVRRSESSTTLPCEKQFFSCLAKAISRPKLLLETRKDMDYILVYLPDVGKIVDKGLSGHFDWKAFHSLRKDSTSHLQLALECLFMSESGSMRSNTFSVSGELLDSVTPHMVFYMRQYLYLFKKVELQCPEQSVHDAVVDFVKIDQGLREPSGSWNHDQWIPYAPFFSQENELLNSHPRGDKLWKTVDRVFSAIVPLREVDRLSISPKHGPGAVADMKTGGDKFTFPYWPSKLEGQFPQVWFTQHREDLHFTEVSNISHNPKEPAARLIAVPKTFKGPRLIASEPIAHQFLQQGLMSWLRDNLSPLLRASINFTSQEESKLAALKASKHGDLATVDLSSASDRLSCWTVERALSRNQSLLACLHAVRTRTIIDGTGTHEGLHFRMKKFAAQGSAVTFPVQTIIYAGLAIAAALFVEGEYPSRRSIKRVGRKVRVFGDDIICPRKCVPILTLMLDSLQLKVNASKTHYSGGFRESCGMDAFRGHCVTPAYHKHLEWGASPDRASSWIEVSNNFHQKGLWETSSWMYDQVPEKFRRKMITSNEDGDGYRFFTFCKGYLTQAQVRYSPYLHRHEARVFAPRVRVRKKNRGSWNDLYEYFLQAPLPQSKWSAGYITRKTSRIQEVWVPIELSK